ncbi:hypothetical protein N7508_004303 [Penicillium antarcticum]|uniref:uncharacterized protein n=1 Tax=Penicillium antarcticum TaxID=416450 RepID=UPI002399D861|nr:uncharacterized protein N7508_004303 [Penicillium antarcticum]KAJ5308924.1 hypothetical protein N7508_004303 [Penicillium antarcticum]
MADIHQVSSSEDEFDLPPGTFKLIRDDESDEHGQRVVMLDPMPSNDPNEPLNWSTMRKSVNFTIVLAMTIIIFTALSIQAIFWQQMTVDLQVTYTELNRAMSVNFVGLATGCIFFIPFARKYGRRPVYIVSTAFMLITSFWTSRMHSITELYVTNLLQGLAGATNESIAEITIADLFFVHHRGSMNGLYMTCVMIGSFLTPMAAGTQATRQGWRMSYQTMGVFNAVLFLCFCFLYEETKYVPLFTGRTSTTEEENEQIEVSSQHKKKQQDKGDTTTAAQKIKSATKPSAGHHHLDLTIPCSSWTKRLALITPTPEPIWPHFYRPFRVFIFPAVAFAALQYAAGVVWLTILSNVLALTFPLPPYNFTPEQIGFMSVGPFIGNVFGAVYGGVLGDRSILYFSRRNKGYYEPEMRLYILHLPAILMAGGLIMFGVTISRGMHWIYPSVAGALFGFGLGSIGDAALVLVMDSYQDITGEAFTAVAFMRNAVSIGIPFAISPWIQSNGLQTMFIACGFISFGVTLTIIPMVIWGKDVRRGLAGRYRGIVEKHGRAGPR